MIVPKRLKLGWTLNFAHPLAFPALLAMVTFVLCPFFVAGMFGIDLHGYDWVLFFVLVIVLCTFCAFAASPRRYANEK